MSRIRLLVVEDKQQDLDIIQDAIHEYENQKNVKFDPVECKTLEQALNELDNSFDGAIIDLRLEDQDFDGNKVISNIINSFLRIPIAIFTANPGNWDKELEDKIMLIDVFIKGETEYIDVIDRIYCIYRTGLTDIMGGRGQIETALNEVFVENLKPSNIKKWISYATSEKFKPERVQNALLRFTINHLIKRLEKDEEPFFPEEAYLFPHVSEHITTGSIMRNKKNNQTYMVLSPACDLVVMNGKYRTDKLLLAEIQSIQDVLGTTPSKNKIIALCKNKTYYYHWLPETDFFDGGILNFRNLVTLTDYQINRKYHEPFLQISPLFIKDIISRFSSYYARQGQPEIEYDEFVNDFSNTK